MFMQKRVFKTSFMEQEDPAEKSMQRLKPKKVTSLVEKGQVTRKKEEKTAEELKAQSEKETKSTEIVSVKAGRIQFDCIVKETKVLNLLCEECAKDFAIMKCVQCDQIFCGRCCELCHPITAEDEGMHPHEKAGTRLGRPTGKGFRELNHEDTSNVKIEIPFVMPDHIVSEDAFEGLKNQPHTDLTQVNCLAVNRKDIPEPSKQHYGHPRYAVGEQLLFQDPDSGEEAYGRVISEWNFRHGESAPPVIRGDGSGVFYMVHKLGLVSMLGPGGYSELVRLNGSAIPAHFGKIFQNICKMLNISLIKIYAKC